jgi:hypothetical protein
LRGAKGCAIGRPKGNAVVRPGLYKALTGAVNPLSEKILCYDLANNTYSLGKSG